MPGDLGELGAVAAQAMADRYRYELFVLRHEDEDDRLGALVVRTLDSPRVGVALQAVPMSPTAAALQGMPDEELWLRLIRAGVARAAAGGAKEVIVTVPGEGEQLLGEQAALTAMGFAVSKHEALMEMDLIKTRDRCLSLIERLREHGRVPASIRCAAL